MSRPKQIAAVALSVAGLAALAACGGNDSSSGLTPTSSTATSSSPSTTGSATPTSSSTTDKTSTPTATGARASVPEAATKKTDAGAEAFVLYYNEQINSAYQKPSTEALRELSMPNCGFCDTLQNDVRALMRDGLHYDAPMLRTKVIGSEKGKFPDEVTVIVRMSEDRPRKVDASGKVRSRHKGAAPFRLFQTVAWAEGGWRMAEIVQP